MKNFTKLKVFVFLWLWFTRMEKLPNHMVKFVKISMPKVNKILENTFANQQFVKNCQGKWKYKDVNFILVNYVRRRTRYGTYYMMMALPNPNQVVTGYLNFPGDKLHNVPHAQQMSLDISLSPDITTPPAVLLSLNDAIDAYAGAHGSDLVPTYREMIRQFDAILLIFNLFANELVNRPMAISILQHGGFHVKGVGGNTVSVWGVRNSIISGEMIITAPAEDGATFEWWYSSDGINYARIQPGGLHITKFGGLTPKTSAWFKYQHIMGNTPMGISIPIEKIVI